MKQKLLEEQINLLGLVSLIAFPMQHLSDEHLLSTNSEGNVHWIPYSFLIP